MKTFAKIILLVLIAACLSFSLFSSITGANHGTECSMGGIITRQTEEFILSTFCYAKSPEELADDLIDFALDNFVYDKRYLYKPQTADTNRFIFQNDFHGVCMDFSAFVKSVFQVICRYHGWENVGCYVVQGWTDREQDGHAVNYIAIEERDGSATIYLLDTTWDLDAFTEGLPPQRIRHTITLSAGQEIPSAIGDSFSSQYPYAFYFIT